MMDEAFKKMLDKKRTYSVRGDYGQNEGNGQHFTTTVRQVIKESYQTALQEERNPTFDNCRTYELMRSHHPTSQGRHAMYSLIKRLNLIKYRDVPHYCYCWTAEATEIAIPRIRDYLDEAE